MNKNVQNFLKMLSVFAEKNPYPKSDLQYKNPYTFLVAVLLSAQSTDKGVNKATAELFKVVDNPKNMVAMGLEQLKEYVKTIGLYNNKAKNIIALSKILVSNFDGKIPQSATELESLPGIGRKSANVIMNEVFGVDTIAVDTHVIRLVNRFELFNLSDENIAKINTESPLEIEKLLNEITPSEYKSRVSNWLVLHGRYICKAKKPDCANCPVENFCIWNGKNA
ncbi:MAG: endonuclease III [Rickettsiales bacterium]|jgi:endonuclease-3|nr:endonuclease III [Rickettsiales bacterium]